MVPNSGVPRSAHIPPTPTTTASATKLNNSRAGASALVKVTARTFASRLAALVRRKVSMFSSSRLNACTSRTAAMLSCSPALTDAHLLAGDAEGLARLVGEKGGSDQHQRHDGEREQGVDHVLAQHHRDDPDDQQEPAHHLHQREAERLLDRVGVTGQAAHHVARLVRRCSSQSRGDASGQKFLCAAPPARAGPPTTSCRRSARPRSRPPRTAPR